MLGENDNRRFSDIIEAGNTYGWRSFEQSLIDAYEKDLITGETALLYSVNKPMMHQRLDAVNKRRANAPTPRSLKMKADTRFLKKNAPPPVNSPEPEGSKLPAPAGAKSPA